MNQWPAVRRVTAWEFKRFLRPRELLTTVLVVAALGAGVPLVIDFLTSRDAARVVTVAVPPGAGLENVGRFEFVELDDAAATAALSEGEVDGILEPASARTADLVVSREVGWTAELGEALSQAALESRLEASGVSPEQFAALVEPVDLRVAVEGTAPTSGSGPVAAIVGIMLFAIFTGTGLLFTAITGEKSQRVTEQIISAISPQSWIDGKVLGTGLYVIVNMLAIGLGIALAAVVPSLVRGDPLPSLPAVATTPGVVLVTLAFAVLGAALYFTLFAAVAATIDDPATSQRSGIIMLPGLFVGLGFLGLIGDTGNVLFRILSYLPLTSPSAMPVRFLHGDAGIVEALVSLALLVVGVVLARYAAGRIFSLGILMTGKEPSWREMLHWLRRT